MNCQELSYTYGTARGPLVYKTMGQVIEEAAQKWPDKPFIISMNQGLEKTFQQVNEDANRLASAFYSIGLKKGDRIGIWSLNCYEWVVTQFAAGKLGAILVNINPAYKEDELVYGANLVSLNTLIAYQKFKSTNYVDILKSISHGTLGTSSNGIGLTIEAIPSLKNIIFIDNNDDDIASIKLTRFSNFIQAHSTVKPKLPWQLDPEDICNIQFTSGTTGRPKGAALTHHGVINNARFIMMDYVERKSICVPNPLYHCMGCVLGTLAGAILGNTVVLPSPVFTSTSTFAAIELFKCNALIGTPTMYNDLIRDSKGKAIDLTSVECIYMAGSPSQEKLTEELTNYLFDNLKHLVIPYGSTEASPAITVPRVTMPQEYRSTTVGSVIDHAELKIVDPQTGRVLPRGIKGELWTRSVFVFPGYWNKPQATAEVKDHRGWYKTGDLAVMTEDGYILIDGRLKDLIIRGGENIYPREIEDLLQRHEAIAEVNVVGVPDERLGEEVAACVKLKDGFQQSDELKECIKEFCRNKISYFKVPKYVIFLQDFPKTVTFKVQKSKLKQLAESLVKGQSQPGQ